jgi:PAS domain S-box-containing protein
MSRVPDSNRDARPASANSIAPDRVLDVLAETALALCRADAAGVSIVADSGDGESVLRWTALAGRFVGAPAEMLPSDTDACRSAFEHDEPVAAALPGGELALVAPLRLGAGGDATLWVVARGGAERFGADEARALGRLAWLAERMRAEEAFLDSERIYRAIGESIDYGVWVCDAEGRNVYASESFLRLVGLTQEQYSTFGWGSALHPDDAERTIAAWQECVRTGGTWDVEHRYRGVEGAWHPILARGVPVRNERGETTAWAGIHLDISRQKRVEDELRDAHHRKDEFLATLAHELRNPLAPIRNSLAVLRMAALDPEPRRLLEIVERQVAQLVRVVDDLLEVSRITRNRIELRRERVALAAVLHAAVETSRPAIERSRQRLELSLPGDELVVDADPLRLAQVFANLLDNAARFSEPGGRIGLRAWRDGARAVVTVSDDGDGIPSTQLLQVFELFVQGEHASGRAQGGLGIGLTLARRLAELHGGSVEAKSDGPGRGSEFQVTLPLAAEAARLAGRTSPEAAPADAPSRARVLVVDDNHDAADSLGMLLEMLGAETRVAYDGAAALEALPSFRPAMVLLDLGMPVMDGWEVARRIRERAPGVPLLVALTGWGQPDDRRRTREAGFDQHLVKPVELAALKALFTRLEARGAPAP